MPRPIGPRDPRGPGWHMTIHQRVGLLPGKIGGQTQPYSDDRLGRRKNSVGSALGFSPVPG